MDQGQEAVNPYIDKTREELISIIFEFQQTLSDLSRQVEKTKEENVVMKDQNILLLSHVATANKPDKLVEKNTTEVDRPRILADRERRSTLSMPEDQVSELLQNILVKSNNLVPETPTNTPTKLLPYRPSDYN